MKREGYVNDAIDTDAIDTVSNLVRNVPLLRSLEVTPPIPRLDLSPRRIVQCGHRDKVW